MRMSHWLSELSARPRVRARRQKLPVARLSEVFESRLVLTSPPIPQVGFITGAVWNDVDRDGVFDHSQSDPNEQLEPGIAGRTIYIDVDQDGIFDQPVETVESADVPKDLPDVELTTSSLVIEDVSGSITDVNVTLNATHTYRGDLLVQLTSPRGTTVTLSDNTGEAQDDFVGTVFDDQATVGIADAESAEGSFQPSSELAAFNGEDPNGTWTLSITDTAGGDIGNLSGWSITITTDDVSNSEPFAVTNQDGFYDFIGVAVGTYQVRQVLPFGFEQSFPTSSSGQQVVVSANGATIGVDFGSSIILGRIRGQQFDDLNGDGFQDQDDLGVDGVEIQLLNAATREVLRTQTTFSRDLNEDESIDPNSESGLYEFTDLEPGEYVVALAPRDGFVITAPTPGQGDHHEQVVQAGTYTASPPPTGTPQSPAQWLPDLISDMDSDSGMRNWFQDGNSLRFGQASPNVGFGPMRLVAGPNQGDGTQIVYQRIFDDQGGFTDRVAGLFEFHPAHNHIHFNDYAHYQLRAALPELDSDGQPLVGDVVRSADKTSFCLVNVDTFDTTLPNFDADGSGFGCGDNQEISVGWEDIYGAGTEGQEINVAGLEPGQYWLEGIIDPDNHLTEVDETNNYGRVLVTIGPGDRSYRYTIGPASDIDGADFGTFKKVTLSGTVFNDTVGDGLQQQGEAGLAGRAVFLDLNYDGVLNNPTSGDGVADGLAQEPWALTDSNGHFTFHNVEHGLVSVRLVQNPNELLTTENQVIDTVSGHDVTTLTFGSGIPIATLQLTLVDGVLTIRDISHDGQNNQIIVDAGGIDSYLIHDANAVLSTGLGTVIDLHSVTIPKSEVTSLVIDTGLGDDEVALASTMLNFSDIAHMIHSPTALNFTSENLPHTHDEESIIKDEHGGEVPVDFDVNQDGVVDENDIIFILATIFGTGEGEVSTTDIALSNITVTLGDGDDSLFDALPVPLEADGGAGDDELFGFGAAVILRGGDGDDSLSGGLQNDFIDGGSGTDTVIAQGDVDITLTNFSLNGLGSDALMSIESAYLTGGIGNNRLDASQFSAGSVNLFGQGGDDTMIGGAGDDRLIGDNNPLVGIDIGEITSQLDVIDLPPIPAPPGNDVLIAGRGNDTVLGIGGADTFVWNDGDGSDQLFGGPENSSTLQVRLDDLVDVIQVTQNEAGQSSVSRTNRAQFSIFTIGIGNFDINLGGGNDVFNGSRSGAEDLVVSVSGGSGHDLLTGTSRDDVLNGEVGNDTIRGGFGNDQVYGGSGTDSLFGEAGDDTVYGQAGDSDVVSGGLGNDALTGGTGINDTLFEDLSAIFTAADAEGAQLHFRPMTFDGLGIDEYRTIERLQVVGSIKNDLVDATGFSAGPATLLGGQGDDTLSGGRGNDLIDGGVGLDTVHSVADVDQVLSSSLLLGLGTDVLASIEAAVLEGGRSANQINASGFAVGSVTLLGNGGADILLGSPNADLIVGDFEDSPEADSSNALLSDDVIAGLLGDDTLQGGFGSDQFLWTFGDGNDRFEANFESNSQLSATLTSGADHWVLNRGREDLSLTSTDADQSHLTLVGVANVFLSLGAGNDSFDASSLANVDAIQFYVNAGDGNDRIVGGGSSDVLNGEAGRDTLFGNAGDDLLHGGDQADLLDGGDGNDQVLGEGNSGDILTGGRGFDYIDGGNGQDILAEALLEPDANSISLMNNTLVQFDDADESGTSAVIDFVASIESAKLVGTSGDDTLDASNFTRGSVTLQGGAGSDLLTGSRSNDVLDGGADDDAVFQQADGNQVLSNDFLTGRGTDSLIGIEGAALIGSETANVIDARRFSGVAFAATAGGNDQILGGSGGIVAVPGDGDDSVTGGSANDVVAFVIAAHIRVTDTLAVGEGIDTLNGIENAVMVGNDAVNVMDASAFSGNTLFIGEGGDDRFLVGKGLFLADGGAGTDSIVISRATITSPVNLTLLSTIDIPLPTDPFDLLSLDFDFDSSSVLIPNIERADITTGSGSDSIDARAFVGQVTVSSGAGNDIIFGSDLADSINGSDGNDIIIGLGGNDNILGGAGNDGISGGDGNDIINSNAGADTVSGDGGADSINGGSGDDILSGASLPGQQTVATGSELDGNDIVNGDDGNDVLLGGAGDDQLLGGTGNDVIAGGLGNDNLVAGAGNDTLLGEGGNDTLAGAAGKDLALGGDGDDAINAGVDNDADSVDGGAGANSIVTRGADVSAAFSFQLELLLNRLLGIV